MSIESTNQHAGVVTHHELKQTLGTWQLWGIAVGLVISGEYFGWSYGWATAGTLGFVVTALFIAAMYTTFIFSFTELTTSIPHAGGPFAYARQAFGPVGGYLAGAATLVEFVFAPPAISLRSAPICTCSIPASIRSTRRWARISSSWRSISSACRLPRPSNWSSRCSPFSNCSCSWASSRRDSSGRTS
jgi:amino acid transporter